MSCFKSRPHDTEGLIVVGLTSFIYTCTRSHALMTRSYILCMCKGCSKNLILYNFSVSRARSRSSSGRQTCLKQPRNLPSKSESVMFMYVLVLLGFRDRDAIRNTSRQKSSQYDNTLFSPVMLVVRSFHDSVQLYIQIYIQIDTYI